MDTIFALSSGSLPSGVAIIRLSGPDSLATLQDLIGRQIQPRVATLCALRDADGEVLDEALCLSFPTPNSFTGEDVVELHCHGGKATVEAMLGHLGMRPNHRLAEPGEFSRRAFLNNKMDLTATEGLSDLIAAQTESQRRLALQQAGGALRELYEQWRGDLIRSRALIEAEFDFSDEDDIPDHVSEQIWTTVQQLTDSVSRHLQNGEKGEIVRDGFRVALLGAPNAGKSSLLNALAQRDVAIVTDIPGTTRDVLEVSLDIGGQLVIVSDTAGLRETEDQIEQEGIRRANLIAEGAHLVLFVVPVDEAVPGELPSEYSVIRSKVDLAEGDESDISFSTKSVDGLKPVFSLIENRLAQFDHAGGDILMSRARHRRELETCRVRLIEAQNGHLPLEIRSESLRQAGDALGRLTGRIDVEHLLDVIFSEFCVGK